MRSHAPDTESEPLIRVMALHALRYCERLFYLEEVEEIRVADNRVYAGRTMHRELEKEFTGSLRSFELSSETLGVAGKVDAVQHRDGYWTPYEHKRGRSGTSVDGPIPWPSDHIQIISYALLLEEHLQKSIPEGRVRYHQDNRTVRIKIDAGARAEFVEAVEKAKQLRSRTTRPPVAEHERKCQSCSLAAICLPEEERLAADPEHQALRLFPAHPEGQVIHVTHHRAQVSKSANSIVVRQPDEENPDDFRELKFPIRGIQSVCVHGFGQITTQAIQMCAAQGVAVHWFSAGGSYTAGLATNPGGVQRRHRQYYALAQTRQAFKLARQVVAAKIENQLRYILRATRTESQRSSIQESNIAEIRRQLRSASKARDVSHLRGCEGLAAKNYFEALPGLIPKDLQELRPSGRSRRPPKDHFNSLLSFAYALLYREVLAAILAVGLDPSFGFYHTPRSAAYPLVLDLMELFRVALCDMPVIGSINRNQWDLTRDFQTFPDKVLLSNTGRKKLIKLFETRLQDKWKHPVIQYSLSYGRAVELETRLLEKEWSGSPGLFGKSRLR